MNLKKLIKNWLKNLFSDAVGTPTEQQPLDEVPYDTLKWFGTPQAPQAKHRADCVIGNLSVNLRGEAMTYSWVQGGCEALGAPNPSDASYTQCVLGYKDAGGTWRCAKFDWISTSRTFRGIEHCLNGYNKWPGAEVSRATEFCFFIVGMAKGKDAPTGWRSNVIYQKIG